MKVAHITSGVRGLASYALNQYNYFERTGGVENLVITSSKWRKQPINVHELDAWLIGKVIPWAKHIGEVEDQLRKYDPDIIHHHHPAGRPDFTAGRFKKSSGNPWSAPSTCPLVPASTLWTKS